MRRLCLLLLFVQGLAPSAFANENPDAGDAGAPGSTDAADDIVPLLDSFTGAVDADAAQAAIDPAAPSPYDLVITAGRPATLDRTQSSTTIPGDRIRASSRTTVFDVLSQESADVYVPARGVGLHGVANGATGGIRIRGLGGSPNSQILVVEDGVPDYQGIFGHPLPDAYVPRLIDEVLIVKGGDSTLYGTNAMGGVVAIRSRWPDRNGLDLQNDSAFGSYSTLRESLSALGRRGPLAAVAGITAMKTDGHRDGAGGSHFVFSSGLRYRMPGGLRLAVHNKLVHVVGNDPGTVTAPTLDHWFDVWRNSVSLHAGYAQKGVRLSLVPFLNVGIHRLYDGFYSRDYTGGAIGEADLDVRPYVRLLLGVAGGGVGGVVKNRITGEHPRVRGSADLSTYGQLSLRPGAGLDLTVGGRAFFSNQYGTVPLYKAGVRWDGANGIWLQSRVSRNFRQPTIRERYLPYPTANPDLKPEFAVNADAGGGYTGERIEFSVSAYRTHARNLIRYFGAWPAAEVVNIDQVVIPGVEARLALKRLGPLGATVSANWQSVGRYTRQNPNAKVNSTLEATWSFGFHSFSGNLSGEWVHGLYLADYGRQPLPNVFVVDLGASYRHTRSLPRGTVHTLEPYLLVRNLLDARYAYVAGYIMPGLHVLAGLRMGI